MVNLFFSDLNLPSSYSSRECCHFSMKHKSMACMIQNFNCYIYIFTGKFVSQLHLPFNELMFPWLSAQQSRHFITSLNTCSEMRSKQTIFKLYKNKNTGTKFGRIICIFSSFEQKEMHFISSKFISIPLFWHILKLA